MAVWAPLCLPTRQGGAHGQTESGVIVLAVNVTPPLGARSPALSPDRALCLPTFRHFVIVNKTSLTLSLSLSLSLGRSRALSLPLIRSLLVNKHTPPPPRSRRLTARRVMIWLYVPVYVYQSTSGWSLCCGTSTGINRSLLEHTLLRTPFLLVYTP
jgi:hypothetical protein